MVALYAAVTASKEYAMPKHPIHIFRAGSHTAMQGHVYLWAQ